MFKSVSLKMAMMFVLLTISIIILIGSFMTASIEEFYENEFGELMSSVFSEDYIAELSTSASSDADASEIYNGIAVDIFSIKSNMFLSS